MQHLKKLIKSLLSVFLSERDITKCSFVLKRTLRTIHLLAFVGIRIASHLAKGALRGGAYATRA